MKDRKKRNLTIGILCFLLVFMGVGFAVMNATLNINGTATAINTWDVRMTNIEVIEKSEGSTNEEETKINEDGISANFKTDFTKPGDFITYKVTIENNGSIDAVLNDISITLNISEADKDLFNITDTRPNNQLLEAGTSTTFTIKVEFRSDANRMPSADIEYIVKVDYSQQTGELGGEEDWTFKVDESGTIVAYNYEKGTDVAIPAEVDGIPIKRVNSLSFLPNSNVIFVITESSSVVVVKDNQNFDTIVSKIKKSQYAVEDNNYIKEEEFESKNIVAAISLSVDIESNAIDGSDVIMLSGNITSLDLTGATNLEVIDSFSFYNNTITGKVDIPEGVVTIGLQAFNTNKITSLTIPSTITYIDEGAFENNPIEEIIIDMTEEEFNDKSRIKWHAPLYDSNLNPNIIYKDNN